MSSSAVPSALNGAISQFVVDAAFRERIEVTPNCWNWTGQRVRAYGHLGYWSLTEKRSTSMQAHRFVWSVLVGPIPDDMTLDHLCKNTLCVNPDHLRVLDNVTNSLLGYSQHAKNARKTHCPQGHSLSGPNLGIGSKGERLCLSCRRELNRKRDAERKPCPKCQKMLTRAPRTRHRRFGCSTRQPN